MATSEAIADFVTRWTILNAVALVVLALLSYFGSRAALRWLSALDRWWYVREYVRPGEIHPREMPGRPLAEET